MHVHRVDRARRPEGLAEQPAGTRVHRKVTGQSGGEPLDADTVHGVGSGPDGRTGGGCDDGDVVPRCLLTRGQGMHLRLDPAGARRIAVADVDDTHAATVRDNGTVPHTLVFCHAHPDDEALLTSGTMAKAVAAGHRVIVVAATSGEAGLAGTDLVDGLGERRRAELAASADVLGVGEVIHLGYADSGLNGEHDGFAHVDTGEVADRLARILHDTRADTVVGYDPSGGYGHPDHIAVHRMVRAAVAVRPTRTFEATLPREPLRRAVRLAGRAVPGFDPHSFDEAWTPSAQITHRVNVRAHLAAKRASLAAHASQETGASLRTLGVLRRLPPPVFGALLGTEYYVEVPTSSAASTRRGRSGTS